MALAETQCPAPTADWRPKSGLNRVKEISAKKWVGLLCPGSWTTISVCFHTNATQRFVLNRADGPLARRCGLVYGFVGEPRVIETSARQTRMERWGCSAHPLPQGPWLRACSCLLLPDKPNGTGLPPAEESW